MRRDAYRAFTVAVAVRFAPRHREIAAISFAEANLLKISTK